MSEFPEEIISYDYQLKFLLLGESTSGKTSIARRILGRRFRPTHHRTIGVNIDHMSMKLDNGKSVLISLWDLDGEAIFRNARTLYFGNTAGVFLVLDKTRQLDMTTLEFYFEDIAAGMKEYDFSVALLGNKADLEDEILLPSAFIQGTSILLADQIQAEEVRHFEVSAKNGNGVKEAFNWLVETSITRMNRRNHLLDKIFEPDLFNVVLYQLTAVGPEVIIKNFDVLENKEEMESDFYLVNMGVGISVGIAHGQHYSTGIFDLPAPDNAGYRILVYAFRLADPNADDQRLLEGFLQYCMFIPNEYYEYFGDFRKVERRFKYLFSKFSDVQQLVTVDNLNIIRNEILKQFKETARLKEEISPFD